MKEMLKMEMTRAFRNKYMLFSLFVGNVIVILYYIFSASKSINGFYTSFNYLEKITYPISAYTCWIGLSLDVYAVLYFFIMPILVAIPYGASFFLDKKDGYINNILIKTDRKNYYFAKLITLFVSGGVVATVPLVLSYVLAIISIPASRPYVESFRYAIREKSVFSNIFYSNYAFLYVIIFIAVNFIIFGLVNCLCMAFTYWEDNRFAIVLTPFIICYGLHMFGQYYLATNQTPITYARMFFMVTDNLVYVFVELFVFFLLAIAALRGAKKDVI